jgi:hypothetical protein
MSDQNLEERIRREAYQLWLEDGCPHGRDHIHWIQAEQHVRRLDVHLAEMAAAEDAHGIKTG